uniref:Uncharacterized protein n=1 Tax=viral metagenome TaxID=1070528 RepID=A0A6C0HC32_9ZZZZ
MCIIKLKISQHLYVLNIIFIFFVLIFKIYDNFLSKLYKLMSFEQQIQQWVSIDNKIRLLNDQIKELREKKTKLSDNLNDYAKENNLSNATIQISDGKLKFASTKVQSPLTFKYLEKSLGEIIKNENQVKQIVEYIKSKREVKVVSEIKRFSNN